MGRYIKISENRIYRDEAPLHSVRKSDIIASACNFCRAQPGQYTKKV